MKNNWLPLIGSSLLVLVIVFTIEFPSSNTDGILPFEEEEGDKLTGIKYALEDNFERTKDPVLGYPPAERLLTALEQTKHLQAKHKNNFLRDGEDVAIWKERGPLNIGGRTRSIHIDFRDPERKKIWAGSVAGGLWKTEDITADPPVWENVNDFMENLAISSIAQDPSNPNIMYAGTGESFRNLDAIRGIGIFKSENGGQDWFLLPSTLPSRFRSSRDILVHPSGDVYLALQAGVYRSQDKGETWEKVLGQILPNPTGVVFNDNFFDLVYVAKNDHIYACNTRAVFKTPTGNIHEWERLLSEGFPTGLSRIEMDVNQSNPDFIYVVGSIRNEDFTYTASPIYRTINGGDSWEEKTLPMFGPENGRIEFTRGQSWYDLEIAVHPNDPNHVIVGGVPSLRSLDGGLSWQIFANNMHVDQHKFVYDLEKTDVIYFGNDGGVYRSENGSAPQVDNKNSGYNVTQFYASAIHPEAYRNYFLGGTQDNNSLQLIGSGIVTGRRLKGGDGFYCFIDEDEPELQFVSSQFANYAFSNNGGQFINFKRDTFSAKGSFISPADYDSKNNILYSQSDSTDLFRYKVKDNTREWIDISGLSTSRTNRVSTITVDPNNPKRIYLGQFSGNIVKVEDATNGSVIVGKALRSVNRTVSSIDIEIGNPDHILVTVSNYGAVSVLESIDGGQNWINVEGADLPDIPVRWGIFNPANPAQAMIATEIGVWYTDKLNGDSTVWFPPEPGKGTPLVRTDMLRIRKSDRVVLAATHGRGLYTSDYFADPKALAVFSTAHYTNSPLTFRGDQSLKAEAFLWDLGDGNTSNESNTSNTYTDPGLYEVSLTINNELTEIGSVTILPDLSLPYLSQLPNYEGNFELESEHFAVYNKRGSDFERGQSSIEFKSGANSGSNAYVLGITEGQYQPETEAYLYLPNYNFEEEAIYEISFWGKYEIQDTLDGFRLEYSTNRGQSWQTLGSIDEDWYNFENKRLSNNPNFSLNGSYFTGTQQEWKQYKRDISFLLGQKNVAFRFVFKSNASRQSTGLAIDDFELLKFAGTPQTILSNFEVSYNSTFRVNVNWQTSREFYADRFIIEKSFNGRDFEPIATIPAKGILSTFPVSYSHEALIIRGLLYFRLRVISESPDQTYKNEFISKTVILSRQQDGIPEVARIFPNPFRSFIDVSFDAISDETVQLELFDVAGRLLVRQNKIITNGINRIETSTLSPGVYFLRVKVGDREAVVSRLVKEG